jgi:transposase InsO family protein
MKARRPHYPLAVLCRVFDVSRSGYHAWMGRMPSKRAQENNRLEVAIQAAHVRTRRSYGPERLQPELKADGFRAGVGRIKRLRKKLGIRCQQVRRFKATTNSRHNLPVAQNLLDQKFAATRPNETDAGWTDWTAAPPTAVATKSVRPSANASNRSGAGPKPSAACARRGTRALHAPTPQ